MSRYAMNKLQIIICLLFINIGYIESNLQVTFLEAFVVFNPEHIKNHTVRINPDRSSLNIVLDIPNDYKYDPWVNFKVEVFMPRTQQYRNIVAYDLNICSILGKSTTRSTNLFQIFFNNFLKDGTMPKSCPIKKGVYYWRRFKLTKGTLPPFVSQGKYRVELITYFRMEEEQIKAANVTTVATVRSVKP